MSSNNTVQEASAAYLAQQSGQATNAQANSAQTLITQHLDLWSSAITAKQTTGRGSSKKIELYGVKKLRELILELAVRGKLVPQDSNDEPAETLLHEIEAQKLELIKNGSLGKSKPLPAIENSDLPFFLPFGWSAVRFGQIATIERGGSPRPIKDYITQEPSGLNWIKIGDTDIGGKYISSAQEKIKPDGLHKTRMVYPGDFLLTNSMSFGRPYITKIEGCIHDGWLRISPFDVIDKDFLYLLLSSPYVVSAFKASASGAVVQNLNSEKVRETLVYIPPLPEQHRIVAKVDELMVLCDQVESQTEQSLDAHTTLADTLLDALTQAQSHIELMENWQRLEENWDILFPSTIAGLRAIDKLKQTILQLAVMGRLVPQNPNDEPASELLKRIAAEKEQLVKDKKIKKQKPLPPIADEEKPFELPEGWGWCYIDDVFAVTGGLQKTPKRAPKAHHFPYLAVANVQRGSLELSEMKRFEVTEEELLRYRLEINDLLVVEGNGSESEIGRCAIWSGEVEPCLHQNHLIRCRPVHSGVSNWTLEILNSPFGVEEMKCLAVTSSGLYNLSVGKIKSIKIPLPPLEEQKRIVAKVEELTTLCDQLKQRLQAAQQTQQHFTDAVVAGAL